MTDEITKEAVLAAISKVEDPALKKSLTSAMLIKDVDVKKGKVSLTLSLISPAHPYRDEMVAELTSQIKALDGVKNVEVRTEVNVPVDGKVQGPSAGRIKTVVAVASGKGGVGKSTVAVNIAVSLAQEGAQVGLMDADVYGPNIPLMMGVDRMPAPTEQGKILPAEAYGVKMISIGFMVKREQPIVWRGPMLHTAIRQFVEDVKWGDLDYLVVDLPPGTGDAQLSLAQTVSITGGVIVTLPQQVSLEDARRGLEMFRQLNVPIFGVVENMSYLELPDGQKMDIFGSGGGEKLAEASGVSYLGAVPMDPAVREGGDGGKPIVIAAPKSPGAMVLKEIALEVALRASVVALNNQSQSIPINIVN